jgi:peroxin-16
MIYVVQHFRACVRLAAFRESGYRMLLQGGEVENEEEDIVADNHGVKSNGVPVIYPMNGHPQNGHEIGSNGLDGKAGFISKSLEGRAVAALNKFGQNAKMMSDPMWMTRLQPTPVLPGNLFFTLKTIIVFTLGCLSIISQIAFH